MIDTDQIRAEIGETDDDALLGILELVDEIDRLRFQLVLALAGE